MPTVEDVVVWRGGIVASSEDAKVDGDGSIEHGAAHPVWHEETNGARHRGQNRDDRPEDADRRQTE